MDNPKILMFAKKHNIFCDFAEVILKNTFKENEIISIRGNVGDRLDDDLHWYSPEYIISFVSPWIIPKSILNSAKKAAINFHPGSPEYPGTGCYNFALYEGCKRYGVTVHHMKEKVDTGDIIMTSYFDVAPFETVETMKLKSMNHLLYLFEKILYFIVNNEPLPVSSEIWKRKPFTRKEMLELFEVNPQLHSKEEIEKRILSASYPNSFGAFINIGESKFYAPFENRAPLV